MHSLTRFDRLLVAGLAAVAAAVPLAQAAQAGPAEPPEIPTRIQVDDGHKLFSVQHAIGVQIYKCNATPTGHSWGFVAPRADLYDDKGRLAMTHYAGPTWQARDGSQVKAQRVDGVNVDPTAIDWLKLSKASSSVGPDGDLLHNTSFIQRINTTGGLAPAAGTCTAATAGTVEEVPYTADYYFYKPAGR
jgi:Protein of unknown function (DUF3455)